jgi:hypothetical protein
LNYIRFDCRNQHLTTHRNNRLSSIAPSYTRGIEQAVQERSPQGNLLDCRLTISGSIFDDVLCSISKAGQFLFNGEFNFVG